MLVFRYRIIPCSSLLASRDQRRISQRIGLPRLQALDRQSHISLSPHNMVGALHPHTSFFYLVRDFNLNNFWFFLFRNDTLQLNSQKTILEFSTLDNDIVSNGKLACKLLEGNTTM